MRYEQAQSGFTLLEALIGLAILTIVSTSVFFTYSNVLDIIIAAGSNSAALTILNNEIELIRNVPYPDVGIRGGSPPGALDATKTVLLGNAEYTVTTTIHNVDDVFDGIAGGTPSDTIPGDYKLVHLLVSCAACRNFVPAELTTTVAPRSMESATRNGSLFLNVIDASGSPVSGATFTITNSTVVPAINITDTSDVSGSLNFVDIATISAGYRISVTKSGYSTDRTYPLGDVNNPNPLSPDATVLEQQRTTLSFSIDRLGTLTFKTTDKYCKDIGNVSYHQTGEQLIGYDPDIFKYDAMQTTDATGVNTNNALEWDTYNLENTSTLYDVIGTVPFMPVAVAPASSAMQAWVMEPKQPMALMVSITDENDAPMPDATVRIEGNGIDATKLTGRAVIDQTDWSGTGDYTSMTSHLDATIPGQLTLSQVSGKYASNSDETLISKTFDLGTTNASLYTLGWNAQSQPANTTLKFQLAANNDNATWNYVGPGGNGSSYFTTSGTAVSNGISNKRYLRYKGVFRTSDQTVTPTLTDIDIDFRSSCTAEGQTLFTGLPIGTYTITVSAPGYEDIIDTVDVTSDWQEYSNTMAPL